MKRFLLACLLCYASPAWADDATIINDPAEAQKLLGRHLFNERALSGDDHIFGEADITVKDGIYLLNAQQISYRTDPQTSYRVYGGNIKITGVITEINSNSFVVKGHIDASSDEVSRPETTGPAHFHCKSDDVFTFVRRKHRAYWMIQDQSASCVNQLYDIKIFSVPRIENGSNNSMP